MPDENSPVPSNAPKKETVRINIPPKASESAPAVKRETVRINVPAKPSIPGGPGGTPPVAAKPFVPPLTPTKPAGGAPPPPVKPLPGMGAGVAPGAPRPPALPSLGAKPPGIPPLQPAGGAGVPGAPTAATYAGTQPVTMKAAPKKETARIQAGAEKPSQMPKATVKMVQTQPLAAMPAPIVRTAAATTVDTSSDDSLLTPLSIAALLISLVVLVLNYLAYSAV